MSNIYNMSDPKKDPKKKKGKKSLSNSKIIIKEEKENEVNKFIIYLD